MNETNIDTILDKIYPLPEPSKNSLRKIISEVRYPKGFCLLKSNKIEHHIYFIKKGIVRAYVDTPEKDVTFWFGQEGDTVVSMRSYIANEKGYENIELLEDSILFELNTSRLHQLFFRDIHLANWGRKFVEGELVKTEERLISMQFQTARERYETLIRETPNLLQRVQLGQIASYLGMTQVSLSRIRAKK